MTYVWKSSGFKSSVELFVKLNNPVIKVDQDDWLISTFRALKNYFFTRLDPQVYDIRFGFPSSADLGEPLPLERPLIHLEIDDVNNDFLGFGDNVTWEERDEYFNTVTDYEAQMHDINWDVGIWTSARNGGYTTCVTAWQALQDLLHGPLAQRDCLAATDIDIRSFTSGQCTRDQVDNVEIFRVVGMALITTVSNRKGSGPIPMIQEIFIEPTIEVTP